MSWLFTSDGPSIGAFSISPSNEYSKLISFRIEWFDLLAPRDSTGLSRVFSRTRTQKSNNSLAVSLLYDPTLTPIHSYWKAMALIIRTFVVKVTSLLFNTLSRFVIAFLPRSKPVLISWLQSPSIVILEPKKIVSEPWPLSSDQGDHCVPVFPPPQSIIQKLHPGRKPEGAQVSPYLFPFL